MIKIIQTLVIVRLRKFLPSTDKLAFLLFFCAYLILFYCLNEKFQILRPYSLLFSLEIFFYHTSRKDIELLKQNSNWKSIIIGEYFVYSCPYLILFLLNKEYLLALLYYSLNIAYIFFPQFERKTIRYPFKLFDPFWSICWRKNKLILFFPITIFFVIVGDLYHNDNLIMASFFVVSLLSALPSFNREAYESIKMSGYSGKDYLSKQFKIAIVNSVVIVIPLIITLSLFQRWILLCFIPLIFLIPLSNIIFKYSFYNNQFLHQLMFIVFLIMLPLGLPIVAVPFLYLKSIKTIKAIQYV